MWSETQANISRPGTRLRSRAFAAFGDDVGRRIFGAASLALGIASIALHDQLISNRQLPGGDAFLVVTSLVLIAGGGAIAFRRTARAGAVILGGIYGVFALTSLPEIFAHPTVYASFGEVMYRLASVSGAAVAFCSVSPATARTRSLGTAAVVLLGLCFGSFAAEQLEFLDRTASLVPHWVPASGTFWALATTAAFGLAAVALVTGFMRLSAARLVTLMLASFGVLIWIPTLARDPKTHGNWGEGLETFAIAGASWIVAEFLARTKRVT